MRLECAPFEGTNLRVSLRFNGFIWGLRALRLHHLKCRLGAKVCNLATFLLDSHLVQFVTISPINDMWLKFALQYEAISAKVLRLDLLDP